MPSVISREAEWVTALWFYIFEISRRAVGWLSKTVHTSGGTAPVWKSIKRADGITCTADLSEKWWNPAFNAGFQVSTVWTSWHQASEWVTNGHFGDRAGVLVIPGTAIKLFHTGAAPPDVCLQLSSSQPMALRRPIDDNYWTKAQFSKERMCYIWTGRR